MAKKPRTPTPPKPVRAVQAPKRREAPRSRRAVDRRMLGGGIVAALVVIGVVVGIVLGTGGGSSASSSAGVDFATLPGLQQGPPPWTNGSATLPDRLADLKLDQLANEGTVIHIHQHLDLYVNGKKVTLPAGVGIYADSWLTELHTHDTTGVIHVESPKVATYTLGRFFGVWGIRLTPGCVGSECGKLSWWVNGKKQPAGSDPAKLVLKAHQEIAIALGQPPLVVPKSYAFPAGE